jgi:hypothetical protein
VTGEGLYCPEQRDGVNVNNKDARLDYTRHAQVLPKGGLLQSTLMQSQKMISLKTMLPRLQSHFLKKTVPRPCAAKYGSHQFVFMKLYTAAALPRLSHTIVVYPALFSYLNPSEINYPHVREGSTGLLTALGGRKIPSFPSFTRTISQHLHHAYNLPKLSTSALQSSSEPQAWKLSGPLPGLSVGTF